MTKIDVVIDKLSKPVVSISIIIVSVLIAIVYGVMLNVEGNLQQEVQNLPIKVSEAEDTGEIEVETIDVEAQKDKKVTELEQDVEELLCPQKELVDKARTFINSRYNYEGSLSSNKDRILSEVQDIISKTEYDRLQTELQSSGSGNMGMKIQTSSKCEIIDIFTDYKKTTDYNLDNRSALEINVYVAVVMNGSSEVLYNVSFIENSSVWYIDDVELRTNRGE